MLSWKHNALVWPGSQSAEKDYRYPSTALQYVCQYMSCVYRYLCSFDGMSFLRRTSIWKTPWYRPESSSLSICQSSTRASTTSFMVTPCTVSVAKLQDCVQHTKILLAQHSTALMTVFRIMTTFAVVQNTLIVLNLARFLTTTCF